MRRTLEDARRWVAQGTELFLQTADLDEDASREPSVLPGWTRKHLVAHVAANAAALSNLVHWAATREPTPMYASTEQRVAEIGAGSTLPAPELTAWVRRSADSLEAAMERLTRDQWQADVVTAQGRTVPASIVPWLRAREVYVHTVDLAAGVGFGDLPRDFLTALCADVVDKRSSGPAADSGSPLLLESTDSDGRWELPGDGSPVVVSGPLGDLTAYLTGRRRDLTAPDGSPVPTVGPWL